MDLNGLFAGTGLQGPALAAALVPRAPAVDALAALSDTFSGSSLDAKWSIFKPTALATSDVASGRYRHTATAGGSGASNSFWYNADTGYLVHQEVAGDCEMRCRQTVWNDTFDGLPAASNYRLVGIAIHNPDRSVNLNYVHVAAGVAAGAYSMETKNTVNSSSSFPTVGLATSNPWVVDLVLRRVGSEIRTYYRNAPAVALEDDTGLVLHQTYTRSDLPATCQWGIMGYANVVGHDVGADVDQVIFQTPA